MNCDGQTEKIRKHIHEMHWPVYRELVLSHKLKGWEGIARGEVPEGAGGSRKSTQAREPFTLDGFYTRLLKWVAVDDQVHLSFYFWFSSDFSNSPSMLSSHLSFVNSLFLLAMTSRTRIFLINQRSQS